MARMTASTARKRPDTAAAEAATATNTHASSCVSPVPSDTARLIWRKLMVGVMVATLPPVRRTGITRRG